MAAIITAFVSPLGTALALLLLALAARGRRYARAGTGLLIAATLWLYVWSTPAASLALRGTLEAQVPARPAAAMPQADAIVVLGGGAAPAVAPARPHAEVGFAGDRVLHAARLWHAGKAPVIVASGTYTQPGMQRPEAGEAGAMQALLGELGVPADRVLLEPASRDTEENAAFTARLLAARGARHVLLVTSALHMPRARWLFEREGLQVTPAPTDVETAEARNGWRAWVPETLMLDGSGRAMKEWVGWAAVKVLGSTGH